MDLKTVTFVGMLGALLWELLKQLISAFTKRRQESQELIRKMLRQDIELVIGLVCEILETSISYYSTEFSSENARNLSTQIKAKSKTVGLKLNAVNIQLIQVGNEGIEVRLWTLFKSKTGEYLDVTRAEIWSSDDARFVEIYKSAHHMHISLNKARYAIV